MNLDFLVDHVFFECFRALVVETLESGTEACIDKHVVDAFVGGKDGAGRFVWHGLCVDGVAVKVVGDEQLGVSCAGWDDETPGLVGEDLPGWACWHTRGIAIMCAFVDAIGGCGEGVVVGCRFGVVIDGK